MPWAVFTDTETLDLIDAAAEMAAAALEARSKRIDEDDVIKRSVDLQRQKIATIRASFNHSPLADFSELPTADRTAVEQLLTLFIHNQGEPERDAIWKTIRDYMLRPGQKIAPTFAAQPRSDGNLPGPSVRSGEGAAAQGTPRVRKVRRKSLD